nr:MAG TPA_asm: hypothetical protein [Bacteriophage sp.]
MPPTGWAEREAAASKIFCKTGYKKCSKFIYK